MTRQEVYGVIETMASNQGFYGRLLERLSNVSEETRLQFLDTFTDCKDMIDVLMLMEG